MDACNRYCISVLLGIQPVHATLRQHHELSRAATPYCNHPSSSFHLERIKQMVLGRSYHVRWLLRASACLSSLKTMDLWRDLLLDGSLPCCKITEDTIFKLTMNKKQCLTFAQFQELGQVGTLRKRTFNVSVLVNTTRLLRVQHCIQRDGGGVQSKPLHFVYGIWPFSFNAPRRKCLNRKHHQHARLQNAMIAHLT